MVTYLGVHCAVLKYPTRLDSRGIKAMMLGRGEHKENIKLTRSLALGLGARQGPCKSGELRFIASAIVRRLSW